MIEIDFECVESKSQPPDGKLPDGESEDIDFGRLICIAKAFQDEDEHLPPLHEAIVKGDAAAVNTLLLVGADPNEKTKKGRTPLFYTLITKTQFNQLVCIIRSLKSNGSFLIPESTMLH